MAVVKQGFSVRDGACATNSELPFFIETSFISWKSCSLNVFVLNMQKRFLQFINNMSNY